MEKPVKVKEKRRSLLQDIKRNYWLYIMLIPAIVFYIVFQYIPTAGVFIAFQEYRIGEGFFFTIFGHEWVGFDNFRIILSNERIIGLIRMTILYSLGFMIVNLFASVGLALLLSEIGSRWFKKVSHSMIFLPYFVSWVVVSFITFALFSGRHGLLTNMLASFGVDFNFYHTPWIWPFILLFLSAWKSVGFSSIIYLAVITGTDPQMHESARVDGANVWQRIWHISLPMLKPTIILLTIMGLAGILSTDGGMFFQIVGNNTALHRMADTIDAHILRTLMVPGSAISFQQTTALGLFQQFVGFVLIITVNTIIKFVAPEHAIF